MRKVVYGIVFIDNPCNISIECCESCDNYCDSLKFIDGTGRKCIAVYCDRPLRLEEIGMLLGISRQAVSQRVYSAIWKMRNGLAKNMADVIQAYNMITGENHDCSKTEDIKDRIRNIVAPQAAPIRNSEIFNDDEREIFRKEVNMNAPDEKRSVGFLEKYNIYALVDKFNNVKDSNIKDGDVRYDFAILTDNKQLPIITVCIATRYANSRLNVITVCDMGVGYAILGGGETWEENEGVKISKKRADIALFAQSDNLPVNGNYRKVMKQIRLAYADLSYLFRKGTMYKIVYVNKSQDLPKVWP